MLKLSVKDMINGNTSKYPLVVAVAKRARQLTDEASQNGEILVQRPVKRAFEEIKDDKYEVFDPES